MISNNHTNKVRPKSRVSLKPFKAHNIYLVNYLQCLPLFSLLKQSNLVRQVCLFMLDALTLLVISVCLYYLAVGSCLINDHCFTSYYGE